MNPVKQCHKTRRARPRSGLTQLKAAVKELGGRVIDRRTTLGKALTQWRAELLEDLGGVQAVSTQQAALVDLAVKTKLLLDSIDAWLLTQPTLINKRKRALLPVVRERTQLGDSLARYLGHLGLERRARPAPSLADYLKQQGRSSGSSRTPAGGEGTQE